ncbi:hypothetical protein GALMADRAFT_248559 [Galerina marginata CBS 339.88]|uniref:DUF1746 domain-containing protein n=1 Tax=Galerina marginata (strain CBS 339.88) TaxID=685588 RepID=A0A067TA04_GALM3|nr:hypothetical protein GALMADRAFT_248559 [Galerina marginata CBS 339.88]
MRKRFYAQRLHVIQTLDTLLYQLHTLSFFLSPSIWLYVCRIISQFHCATPRELDPTLSLRFFYAMLVFINVPIFWNHATRGAVEGRAIILDFIGLSYVPSMFQLFTLDSFIIILQLLLITIAYETSVYHASEEADPQDILLPDFPNSFTIPLFHPSSETLSESPQPSPVLPSDSKMPSHTHGLPLIIDLRFSSIIAHLRHPPHPPPPPRSTSPLSAIPLPNTVSWPLPGMRMLMQAGRQMRDTRAGGNRRSPTTRVADGRIPGAMDLSPG